MRYFLDTEFLENPALRTIDLISIGIVAEDGREYYAINLDFDSGTADEWVRSNVLAKLPPRPKRGKPLGGRRSHAWRTLDQIRSDVIEFIGKEPPEFWGYYASYDWVVFCWLFGRLIDLPHGYPSYCRDIKQLMDYARVESIPFGSESEHSAISDARWNRKAHNWLMRLIPE